MGSYPRGAGNHSKPHRRATRIKRIEPQLICEILQPEQTGSQQSRQYLSLKQCGCANMEAVKDLTEFQSIRQLQDSNGQIALIGHTQGLIENRKQILRILQIEMRTESSDVSIQNQNQSQNSRRKTRAVASFLKKTYEILEEPQNHDAIQWANCGIGFIVTQEDKFSQQILPKYFKHSNYSSFVRQLNMYNFHKIREANDESHFHHDSFKKDDKALLSEIKRKPEKKKRKNEESDEEVKSRVSVSLKHKASELIKLTAISRGPQSPESNLNEQLPQRPTSRLQNSFLQIKSWKESSKKGFEDTHHLFHSQKQQTDPISSDSCRERISIQNILCHDNDDDKISINNELVDRFPRYPTKEIFCPSRNNIYPFPHGTPISNKSLLF